MNMSEKQLQVLYVEDDQEMARSLALALKRYNISLTAAGSYHRAWQLIQTRCFDLYLIDVFLKDGNGFDLCREIREYERTPVIFLTSAADEPEQIKGYEIGGDAYVSKPFTIESLMARVHAVMRRQHWQNVRLPNRVLTGNLKIDFSRMSVWRNAEPIALTKMQFRILQLLVENAIKFSATRRPPYCISILGAMDETHYEISIRDNGPGFSEEALTMLHQKISEIDKTGLLPSLEINGMGLLNIYIRYRLLHGDRTIFRLENQPGGGAAITIGEVYHGTYISRHRRRRRSAHRAQHRPQYRKGQRSLRGGQNRL